MVKEEQLEFLADLDPNELRIVEKKGRTGTPKQRKKAMKEKKLKEKGVDKSLLDVENMERKAFTKDWDKSLSMTTALPIKKTDGTVVKKLREEVEVKSVEDDSEEENDESEEKVDLEGDNLPLDVEEDNEFDNTFDIDNLPQSKGKVQKELSLQQKKLHIANICNAITTDPMETLRRQKANEVPSADVHKLADLLSYLKDPDPKMKEVAMLSCLLVFKDVCPSYRIRSREEYDKSVTLKKETKRIRDYELALLASYQSYLKVLSTTVSTGLGSAKRDKPLSGENEELMPCWELGLSALRCQCELTRFLLHFNMRTSLLESIVTRATQPMESISALCCKTLQDIFASDSDGEVSYELVGIMGKKLMSCKYNVPALFLPTLNSIKLRVHADSARDIRRKAKQNRRKRKRQSDDADAALQEADVNTMAINTKRFQADTLHEVCIIYFRVIKMKVGYALMPTVLENLGKITHLMNIDMVEDLCVLLKDIVQSSPPPPDNIRLLCIHCALKTLSGPGVELNMDDESFVVGLRILLCDLPIDFPNWDVVFECVDMCLLRKRDVRNSLILSFVRLLLVLVPHLLPAIIGVTALGLVHSILLRYPRVRLSVEALSNVIMERDDEVGDYAMQALKSDSLDPESNAEGDGSWILPLINRNVDSQFAKIIRTLTSKTIMPNPIRLTDGRRKDASTFLANIDKIFDALPKHVKVDFGQVGGNQQSSTRAASVKEKNKRKKMKKNQNNA